MEIKGRKGLGRLERAGVAVTDREYALYKAGDFWYKKYLYSNSAEVTYLLKADDLVILPNGTIVYCLDGKIIKGDSNEI